MPRIIHKIESKAIAFERAAVLSDFPFARASIVHPEFLLKETSFEENFQLTSYSIYQLIFTRLKYKCCCLIGFDEKLC